MSHYDTIGGGPAVKVAVERFYQLVLADPALTPYFVGANMSSIKSHQAALISQVLGGPTDYTGRELGVAHAGLNIDDPAYDRVVGHLVATFTELGVPDNIIGDVGEVLAGVRPQIVTAPSSTDR